MRPITPQPGYSVADTTAILSSRQFAFADCYTISPRYGDPIRITTAGLKVSVVPLGGSTAVDFLSPANLQISGLRLKVGVGTEVDEQDMQINYDQTAQAWGVPWGKALRLGRLDGATISRDRFFCKSWRSPWVGGIPLFRGRVSSIDSISRAGANVKVKSDLVLLNTNMPRDLYQPGCVHTLYDPGCGLNKESFKQTGTVGAGSTSQIINWSGSSTSLSLGMIYIDTPEGGVTLVRTIRQASSTQLTLAYPLDFVPATGVSFEAYPGCSRTYERCGELANQSHFKGFPFLPVAETAI